MLFLPKLSQIDDKESFWFCSLIANDVLVMMSISLRQQFTADITMETRDIDSIALFQQMEGFCFAFEEQVSQMFKNSDEKVW